jgi:hypothetical protein
MTEISFGTEKPGIMDRTFGKAVDALVGKIRKTFEITKPIGPIEEPKSQPKPQGDK